MRQEIKLQARKVNLNRMREWCVSENARFDLAEAVFASIREVRRMGYEPSQVHHELKPSLWSDDFLRRVVRNMDQIVYGRRPRVEETRP
jgi:hypothetical protein